MQYSVLDTTLQHASEARGAARTFASLGDLPSIRAIETALDLLSGLVSFAVVYFALQGLSTGYALHHPVRHVAAAGLVFSFIAVLLLDRSGAYRASGGLLQVRETACVLEAATLSLFLVLPTFALLGDWRWELLFSVEIPTLALCLVVEKHLLYTCLGAMRKRGYGLRRVLIYGSGSTAKMLYSALARSPKLGLLPVAIIDNGSGSDGLRVHESAYRKGRFLVSMAAAFKASLIRAHHTDIVLVVDTPKSEQELQVILEESRKANATVVFAAGSKITDPCALDYIDLDGQLVYGVHKLRSKPFHGYASRVLDILVSCTAIVLLAPLLFLIYLMVKLDTPGPVFFQQSRIGKDGQPFTIFKYRTMFWASCGSSTSPAQSSDPRITRSGKLLRKTSLDELPQLINIVRGQMALVGPRPEMPFIVATYSATQRQRLAVRPGLTGLWQMSADRCYPIHENLHYDLYYLKHRSVYMDVAILLHTVLFAMNGT